MAFCEKQQIPATKITEADSPAETGLICPPDYSTGKQDPIFAPSPKALEVPLEPMEAAMPSGACCASCHSEQMVTASSSVFLEVYGNPSASTCHERPTATLLHHPKLCAPSTSSPSSARLSTRCRDGSECTDDRARNPLRASLGIGGL